LKTVPISDRVFEILSVLLDGGIYSFAEIESAVGWEAKPTVFVQITRRLVTSKLVEQLEFPVDASRRNAEHCRVWMPAFRITAKGKTAWAEKTDFVRFLVKTFADPERTIHAAPKEGLRPRSRRPRPSKFERRATAAELPEILRHASNSLRVLVEALEADTLPLKDLIALDVVDVHLGRGTIELRNAPRQAATYRPTAELLKLLGELVGHRTEGPVFQSPKGHRWGQQTASRAWRCACRKAGVPPNIMLRGRLTKATRRQLAGVLID